MNHGWTLSISVGCCCAPQTLFLRARPKGPFPHPRPHVAVRSRAWPGRRTCVSVHHGVFSVSFVCGIFAKCRVYLHKSWCVIVCVAGGTATAHVAGTGGRSACALAVSVGRSSYKWVTSEKSSQIVSDPSCDPSRSAAFLCHGSRRETIQRPQCGRCMVSIHSWIGQGVLAGEGS